MTRASSTELLHGARAGDPRSVDELYRRYGRRLLAFVRVRLGRSLRGRVDSQDVMQTVLMRSFERLDQFAGVHGDSLMAWLTRIAENEIRDLADFHHRACRDAAAEVPVARVDPARLEPSPHTLAVAGEEATRLAAALESLDDDYREVILLRKIQELPFRDVAERMGRTEDACRMLLARAMVRLTAALRLP